MKTQLYLSHNFLNAEKMLLTISIKIKLVESLTANKCDFCLLFHFLFLKIALLKIFNLKFFT